MYSYRARCTNVVDGDTVDLIVDVGFHVTATVRVRLLGVDTPEKNADDEHTRSAALEAMAFTKDKLMISQEDKWPLVIETQKSDSFGRWLAKIHYPDGPNMRDISEMLLLRGLAIPFKR